MKTHLVKTLSITLLLSIPCASHALPGDPYDQRDKANAQIAAIQGTITKLQNQLAAIEPKKSEITLASSSAKATDKNILLKTGQQINDLNLLAAQTSLLIKEKEDALKKAQAALPALAARIKTLEPSCEKLPALKKGAKNSSIPIEAFRKAILPSIADTAAEFTNKETYFSKKANTQVAKVKKTDKSAPMLPTKEEYSAILEERSKEPKTWGASIASGASYLASFVYSSKPATASSTSSSPTTTTTSNTDDKQ